MSKPSLHTLVLASLLASLSTGCDLVTSKNSRRCERAVQLLADAGAKIDPKATKRSCIADLDAARKADPAQYACKTKCYDESGDPASLVECLPTCEAGATVASASGSPSTDPIDAVTVSSLKSTISTKYQYRGIDFSEERTNGAGWSSLVTIGRKGAIGDVHLYRVVLVDVKGLADGQTAVDALKKGTSASESRVGAKKALYVECLYNRTGNEAGQLRKCGAYDPLIRSFTDDIATR